MSKTADAIYTAMTNKFPVDIPGYRQFSLSRLLLLTGFSAIIFVVYFQLSYLWTPLVFGVFFVPWFVTTIILASYNGSIVGGPKGVQLPGKHITEYLEFHDAELQAKFGNPAKKRKIDMETLYESYMNQKLSFKGDVHEILQHRHDFVSFNFNLLTHGRFFLLQWIPELLWHSKTQDNEQIAPVYNRGNDFYGAFLGPSMVYTCGIMSKQDGSDSLEDMQYNKIRLICDKVCLKPTDRLLDIGCGWGTLAATAAKTCKSVDGVTISKEQAEFCRQRAKEFGVGNKVNILCHDYRDIPKENKYNKITCVEMAEHVGVRNFPTFLQQVQDMMEDDGVFFMQVTGLRRPWQFEDLLWGLFMAKYIFPGADASGPLAWYLNQLECAGLEVVHVDCIGIHYGVTLYKWYLNWLKNRKEIEGKYGKWWFRLWEVFLAWSSIIGRQGSANCYQFTCVKNINQFDRSKVQLAKRYAP